MIFSLFRTLLISLLLVLNIPYLLAATPSSTVEIPLNDNIEQQVDPLLSKALGIVLVRLTGNPKIIEQKSVAEMINNPNNYLEKYTQQSAPDRLDILFDQSSIENALNKLGIPYWNTLRPSVMTWWVNNKDNQTMLMDDNSSTTAIINTAATTQGFSLQFPISDLNSQALANKASFTAKQPTDILEASKQYATNAILITYVDEKDNKFQGNWQLWLANNTTHPLSSGEIEGASEKEVADKLFILVNDALAKVFLLKSEATQLLDVTINNVDYAHYVQVNNLMNSFDAKIIEMKGATIHYQVKADPAQLKAQLNLLHIYEEKAAQPSTTPNQQAAIPTLIFTTK